MRIPPHKLVVLLLATTALGFQVPRPAQRRLLTTTKALRGGGVVKATRALITRFPLASVGAALTIGVGTGLYAAELVYDVFERYHTAADIPNHRFQDRDSFSVVVVKVADGDTMRARHVPALDFARGRWRPKSRAEGGKLKLSEETLQIRLYAVDAPETAKFGNKGMPMGDEATDFVRRRIEGKRVRITLQSKDQYGRAVAKISYGLFRKDLSEELLANGLATVYRSGGAEYGPGRTEEYWNLIEGRAKTLRKGVWKDGKAADPAAYKRKVKAGK